MWARQAKLLLSAFPTYNVLLVFTFKKLSEYVHFSFWLRVWFWMISIFLEVTKSSFKTIYSFLLYLQVTADPAPSMIGVDVVVLWPVIVTVFYVLVKYPLSYLKCIVESLQAIRFSVHFLCLSGGKILVAFFCTFFLDLLYIAISGPNRATVIKMDLKRNRRHLACTVHRLIFAARCYAVINL